jgi:hypothetical protein
MWGTWVTTMMMTLLFYVVTPRDGAVMWLGYQK